MNDFISQARPVSYDKTISLVLQGGGALGSYQAGVYEALASSEYLPDWVAGISIGAINAAIIAGNAPDKRVAQLRRFWEDISAPTAWWPAGLDGPFGAWQRTAGGLSTLLFGQPGFFTPRTMQEWFSQEKPTSYYSTEALKHTLEQLVDFDRINDAKETRLSLGVVNVRTGRFSYFDNEKITIRPEHVMASGALPPGFPPIEIDGEFYWDGGLVSNTPMQYVLDYYPRRSRLTFQVDVYQALGPLPANLGEVFERDKDIRYSSRTMISTETFREKHEIRYAINEFFENLPPEFAETESAKRLIQFGCVTQMDIVQLVYRPYEPQGAGKDGEFSRAMMDTRWAQGLTDARTTLLAAPWLAPMPKDVGVRVFDVMRDIMMGESAPTYGPHTAVQMMDEPTPQHQPDKRKHA